MNETKTIDMLLTVIRECIQTLRAMIKFIHAVRENAEQRGDQRMMDICTIALQGVNYRLSNMMSVLEKK